MSAVDDATERHVAVYGGHRIDFMVVRRRRKTLEIAVEPDASVVVDTIDYVIVHELCHMAEPHHGAAFYRLLDRVMPDWAGRKGRLEERMA